MNKITVQKIDRETKRIFKNADSVVFRLNENGQSQIELNKKMKVKGYETETQEIFYANTQVENYSQDGRLIKKAVTSLQYLNYDLTWSTIVSSLKKDDEIKLVWIGSNSNNLMKEAGLIIDELQLVVIREGKKKYQFNVTNSICKADSPVRMIQYN